jgi:recombinase-like protein
MPRPNRLPPGAHEAAAQARVARAASRAADLAPIITELQAAGVTSLNGIATALNARGVRTSRGHRHWYASQVARLLKRLAG